MKLDFNAGPEEIFPNFKGGEKELAAQMFFDGRVRIMRGRLAPGASIGLHRHEGNSETIFVLAGRGMALCDGVTETLSPGECHYCPMGSEHTLINNGKVELVFVAVVPQHS